MAPISAITSSMSMLSATLEASVYTTAIIRNGRKEDCLDDDQENPAESRYPRKPVKAPISPILAAYHIVDDQTSPPLQPTNAISFRPR